MRPSPSASTTGANSCANGSPGDRHSAAAGFEQQEFEASTARLQMSMPEPGIDRLLLTTKPDVRYLKGFDPPFWHTPPAPGSSLLPAVAPTAVIPEIGTPAMAATWEDIRTWPAPVPDDDGLTLLAAAIREPAGSGGSVGVTMDPESHLRVPLGDREGRERAGSATPSTLMIRTT